MNPAFTRRDASLLIALAVPAVNLTGATPARAADACAAMPTAEAAYLDAYNVSSRVYFGRLSLLTQVGAIGA